jgi:hypothetical protein
MSAATATALAPLFQEGSNYWEELVRECKRNMEAINSAAVAHGLPTDHLLEWGAGRQIRLIRRRCPSTEVTLDISFERWGPNITGTVTGYQEEDMRFYPQEIEVPLVRDADEGIVGILNEGRSLSAHELACMLTQNFRRCFPGISLPSAS